MCKSLLKRLTEPVQQAFLDKLILFIKHLYKIIVYTPIFNYLFYWLNYVVNNKEKIVDPQMEIKKSNSTWDVFLSNKDSACPFKCEPAKFTNGKNKVDNILQRILAHCKNYDCGCTKLFSLLELSKHEPKCLYSLVQWIHCEEHVTTNQ